MLIKTIIHDKYPATELHICKSVADEEVLRIHRQLHALFDPILTGTDEAGDKHRLNPLEILSFYAEKQRVIARTSKHRYTISQTLTELEEALGPCGFFRIARSELINLNQIKSLDLSLTGTIKVITRSGYETYTSRRNVSRLKEALRLRQGQN